MTDPKSATKQSGGAPLAGQHAVVTGASRGIGAAIAATLARLGADVTLMARNETMLAEQVEKLKDAHGGCAQATSIDVTDEARVIAAFAAASAAFGPVRILVNNAGIAHSAPFGKTSLEQWNQLLAVDLTGPFLCIQQVLKPMVAAGFGRIVNIASTSGLTGCPYVTAYCAAKRFDRADQGAGHGRVAKTGVTVNAVCPGFANADMVVAIRGQHRSEDLPHARRSAGSTRGAQPARPPDRARRGRRSRGLAVPARIALGHRAKHPDRRR